MSLLPTSLRLRFEMRRCNDDDYDDDSNNDAGVHLLWSLGLALSFIFFLLNDITVPSERPS